MHTRLPRFGVNEGYPTRGLTHSSSSYKGAPPSKAVLDDHLDEIRPRSPVKRLAACEAHQFLVGAPNGFDFIAERGIQSDSPNHINSPDFNVRAE